MNISPLLQYVTFPAGFHNAQAMKWLFPACDRNADLHNYAEPFIYIYAKGFNVPVLITTFITYLQILVAKYFNQFKRR